MFLLKLANKEYEVFLQVRDKFMVATFYVILHQLVTSVL